jgi:hypothetical protein
MLLGQIVPALSVGLAALSGCEAVGQIDQVGPSDQTVIRVAV